MPELLLTCLSSEAKALIEKELSHIQDPETKKIFRQIVEVVVNCEEGKTIGVEVVQSGRRGTGEKRAPSRYNLFVGSCMKEGKDMKTCAAKWTAEKQ